MSQENTNTVLKSFLEKMEQELQEIKQDKQNLFARVCDLEENNNTQLDIEMQRLHTKMDSYIKKRVEEEIQANVNSIKQFGDNIKESIQNKAQEATCKIYNMRKYHMQSVYIPLNKTEEWVFSKLLKKKLPKDDHSIYIESGDWLDREDKQRFLVIKETGCSIEFTLEEELEKLVITDLCNRDCVANLCIKIDQDDTDEPHVIVYSP